MSTQKILKFPHRYSIGTLYTACENQPEEWELLSQVRGLVVAPENQPIKWELLEEARGNVTVPTAAKIKLKIHPKGASLAALEALDPDDLHALDLGHSKVTCEALVHLGCLSGLKVLELTSTSVSDEGMVCLGGLTQLQSLGLSYSQVSNKGLLRLANLCNLREIWLSGTVVDDNGLDFCRAMSLMVQLGLSSTKITDSGLAKLAHLNHLLRLYLFNTQVSHNGTQSLRKRLPNCRVKWHPTKIHTQDAEHYDDQSVHLPSKEEVPSKTSVEHHAPKMDEEHFWHLIHLFDWSHAGNDSSVVEPAVSALCKMSVQEIYGFAEKLAEALYLIDGESYARQIGEGAFVGSKAQFSKNWFLYTRCCVVANGKEFYKEVLSNPDKMPKDMEFQALLSVPSKAYKRKTGERFNYTTRVNYETFSNRENWGVGGD